MRKDCITQAKNRKIQKEKDSSLVSCIIIADSPAARMKSYGPSSLLSINSGRLIDIQLEEIFKSYQNVEVVLCTGFESDKIARYIKSNHRNKNVRIVENQKYDESNSCETLRLALNNISNNKIVILDGNIIFDSKALTYHDDIEMYTLFEDKNPTLEIGLNINEDHEIEYIGFGASKHWSEILFINHDYHLSNLRKLLSLYDFKRKFVFEAVNSMLNSRGNIKAIKNQHKSIFKIQNIKSYHYIKGNIK